MRTKLLVVSCMLVGVASAASAQTTVAQCSGLTKLQDSELRSLLMTAPGTQADR